MLAASGAYAQEAGQHQSQRAESAIQKPVEIDVNEKLLGDAEALMKAGKPDLAYKLLEPFEFDRAGEVRFDYLLGIAALDSGKPDKATLAFERVLAEFPNYAGARLDMARAYYQIGDMQRAKSEFETVLNENPSDAARATIEKYLDDIVERETGNKTHISGYAEGTVGRDDNVNNASENPGNIITPTLYPTNNELSDNYYGAGAGGEISHDLNTNFRLYAGADIGKRNNYRQKSFNLFSAEERAGMIYGTAIDSYRIGMSGGQNTLGGARYYDSSGGECGMAPFVQRHRAGQPVRAVCAISLCRSGWQVNDINQLVAGVGMLHTLGKSTLSGSLYFGTENDVGPATAAKPAGGRTDGAKHFAGIRAGGQAAVRDSAKLFFSAGEQLGYFSNVDPVISGRRVDRLGDLTVGVNWYPDDLWVVRPQFVRYLNTSNVAAYAYDRNDYSLTVRRNFK